MNPIPRAGPWTPHCKPETGVVIGRLLDEVDDEIGKVLEELVDVEVVVIDIGVLEVD